MKAMMMYKGTLGQNVLTLAAGSGNKHVFDSALAAAENLLSSSEVRRPLCLTKLLTLNSTSNNCLGNLHTFTLFVKHNGT